MAGNTIFKIGRARDVRAVDYRGVLCMLVLLFYALVALPAQSAGKLFIDINYAGDTNVYHRMDIHLPESGLTRYPVVIAVYGSAFFGNNLKEEAFRTLGYPLVKAGFAVVTVNHRSSRDDLFPAQIHDIKAAVRFVRAQGTAYHLDTSFIGITGYSSGGHLSVMTGTTGNNPSYRIGSKKMDLEGKIGNFLHFSSSVDAVVDWFGPTDFLVMDSCGSEMHHDTISSPESSLVGGPIQEEIVACAFANPISYVDPGDPPFQIFHGDADPLVPWCESELLYQALMDDRVPVEFIRVPGGKHGPGVFNEENYQRMVEFFRLNNRN
ncbi:MAG: alpha/beta hydrolase [Saprospiraceae bacterium]